MLNYNGIATSEHGRDEEMQWARIMSSGNAAAGMALLISQKLCTTFHEFDPAYRAGALSPDSVDYFRRRLANRARNTLNILAANGMDNIDGAAGLRRVLQAIDSAQTLADLAELAEVVHGIGHTLAAALEGLTTASA